MPITDSAGSVVVRKIRDRPGTGNWLLRRKAALVGAEWSGTAHGRLSELLPIGWGSPETWGVWGVGEFHVLELWLRPVAGAAIELDADVQAALLGAESCGIQQARGTGAYPVTHQLCGVASTLAREGNDAYHLGTGWSGDEPGYRWAIDDRSELWLENPGSGTDLILELDIDPFVVPLGPADPTKTARWRFAIHLIGEVSLVQYLARLAFMCRAAFLVHPVRFGLVFLSPGCSASGQNSAKVTTFALWQSAFIAWHCCA